jgi:EAL domain-containing protein (putative c-di-GMP-specific phosphodiesterase class I)
VHQADLALYRSKSEGRQSASFFEADMDFRAQARLKLEMDLRDAVSKNEFELHFQPILEAQSGKLRSFEALLRWRHPVHGLVSPAEFIPIAEDTGLINEIGEWVLSEACRQAVRWPDHIGIAVNVSPVQFKKSGLALTVIQTLARSGLAPHRLEIEVTEAVLLDDTSDTQHTLRLLRDAGIEVALDDFGTGYSSLSYLDRFRFTKLKIDRSFIARIDDKDGSLAIVRAITTLARDLGISVIAEGVETEEQLAHLRAIQCQEVQGFLFSPPRPSSDFDELIAASYLKGAA